MCSANHVTPLLGHISVPPSQHQTNMSKRFALPQRPFGHTFGALGGRLARTGTMPLLKKVDFPEIPRRISRVI